MRLLLKAGTELFLFSLSKITNIELTDIVSCYYSVLDFDPFRIVRTDGVYFDLKGKWQLDPYASNHFTVSLLDILVQLENLSYP